MLKLATADETFEVRDDALPVTGADPDVVYVLRHLTKDARREIIARHTKRKPNPATRQMESVTDWAAVGDDIVDYALVGWRGLLANGAEAPCEREFKLLLDEPRLAALIERAGLTQSASEDATAASFRRPA